MNDELRIPAGTVCVFGAPAKKPDPRFVAALERALSKVDGVAEAHLPQFYAQGVTPEPGLALCVVLTSRAKQAYVLSSIDRLLSTPALQFDHVDVLFFDESPEESDAMRSTSITPEGTEVRYTYRDINRSLLSGVRSAGQELTLRSDRQGKAKPS